MKTNTTPTGGELAVALPISARAKEYHAWRARLAADPTCWIFSEREEAIAFAAFIAGWWRRTGDNPDEFFNPPNAQASHGPGKMTMETNTTPTGGELAAANCSAGLYRCECEDSGVVAPRGVVEVIADERGFPTILIDEVKRWPLKMLPPGCRLIPLPNSPILPPTTQP